MSCLHHLIEAQSRRTPDADALAFEGRRLTYRELERRASEDYLNLLRILTN